MNNTDMHGDDYPSLIPDNTEVVKVDPEFLSVCQIQLKLVHTMGYQVYGPQLVTYSNVWGLIFRVDYSEDGKPCRPGLINRFMCWNGKNGHPAVMCSIGQDIPPLR